MDRGGHGATGYEVGCIAATGCGIVVVCDSGVVTSVVHWRCTVEQLGSNVQYEVVDGKLRIVVDLSSNLGKSKSGKTTIVATTGGGQRVPGTDVTVGLNVYR